MYTEYISEISFLVSKLNYHRKELMKKRSSVRLPQSVILTDSRGMVIQTRRPCRGKQATKACRTLASRRTLLMVGRVSSEPPMDEGLKHQGLRVGYRGGAWECMITVLKTSCFVIFYSDEVCKKYLVKCNSQGR